MTPGRCDYCANHGHTVADCPHLGKHLLDPSPEFNGLRSFVKFVDGKLDAVGCNLSEQAISAHEMVTP